MDIHKHELFRKLGDNICETLCDETGPEKIFERIAEEMRWCRDSMNKLIDDNRDIIDAMLADGVELNDIINQIGGVTCRARNMHLVDAMFGMQVTLSGRKYSVADTEKETKRIMKTLDEEVAGYVASTEPFIEFDDKELHDKAMKHYKRHIN